MNEVRLLREVPAAVLDQIRRVFGGLQPKLRSAILGKRCALCYNLHPSWSWQACA